MKTRKAAFILLFLFLPYSLCPSPVYAADRWTKFGRGVSNILFGWVEVPSQVNEMAKTERWPIAVAGGIPKGVLYAAGRMIIGVYETATFPIPIPQNYEVMIEPEFVVASNI